MRVDRLIVNNVIKTTDSDFMKKKAAQQALQLNQLRERYGQMQLIEIPLLPGEVRGIEALRQIAGVLDG